MDVKKWCAFNFKRGETGGGHCTNESCRFLHPDPPRSRDDPKWCADDHREDGGCLDFDCPLYHLRSCYKSQIKHFMKVRRSHEQSPQISRRIGGPSYEIDIKSSSNKPKFRKRSFEKSPRRSSSPMVKRKKVTTRLQPGLQYKTTKEFSKEDVSSKYRQHNEKLSVFKNELVTFLSMCADCENYCSFARVRNQFGEKGFVPTKCIEDSQSVPFTCPLSPDCQLLLFSDEEALHSHLCLHHFHEELKMRLKSSNRCPSCDERMESDKLILHYGSAPHHKVVSLVPKGIAKAVETFKEQNDLQLEEKIMKINLGHREAIKEILQTDENDVVDLKEKLQISEMERNRSDEEKRSIETERDELDSDKIDFINDVKAICGNSLASKVTDLKSVIEIIKHFKDNSNLRDMDVSNDCSSSSKQATPEIPSENLSYQRGVTSGKNVISENMEYLEIDDSTTLKLRISELNENVKNLEACVSKTKSELYDMEKERDEIDEKFETSEQMRKDDSEKFTKQNDGLRRELSLHEQLFSELHVKIQKKDTIIKNIVPLIEMHLGKSLK